MKNEPVAWARQDGVIAFHKKPEVDSQGYKWFPLYTHPASLVDWSYQQGYQVGKETHPAKTLTDEFIYKNHVGYLSSNNEFYAPDYPTWKQDGFTPIYKEPVAKTLTDFEIKGVLALDECWIGEDSSMPNMIAFARAILRKAQEKC